MGCSICGSLKQLEILDFGPIPLCDNIKSTEEEALHVERFSVKVLNCNNCGHSELEEKAPEELIYKNYTYRTSFSPILDEHFSLYANKIEELYKLKVITKKYPSFLDIGGNDGVLASIMSSKGFKTSVIDPSPAAEFCAGNISLYNSYLTPKIVDQFLDENGPADIISCNNCIANIRDLKIFAESISIALSEGGLLFIETGYLKHQLENRTAEMVNHEHYHYFTIGSLVKLFSGVGISIINWSFIKTKGGSIRCVGIKSANSKKTIPPIIDETLDAGEFLAFINERKINLKNLIQGRDIDCFGSSAGTTILCYLFELDKLVTRVVDDNKSRHGKYMPGTGAQIIGPETWYKDPKLVTVNCAWRFGKLISEKHRLKLPEWSKFIDVISLKD